MKKLLAAFLLCLVAMITNAQEPDTAFERQNLLNHEYSAGSRYTTRFYGVDYNFAWQRIDAFMYEQWSVNCSGPQLLKQQGNKATFVARETNMSGKPISFYFECVGDSISHVFVVKKLRVEGDGNTVALFFIRFWDVPFRDVKGPLHYNYKGERVDFKFLPKGKGQITTSFGK